MSNVVTRSQVRAGEITDGVPNEVISLPPMTHPEGLAAMVEMKELAATSWFPIVPQEARSFKLLKEGRAQSMNFSSDVRQPAEKDGKNAHFLPCGKREEPS